MTNEELAERRQLLTESKSGYLPKRKRKRLERLERLFVAYAAAKGKQVHSSWPS